jgi:hypothetical protein
MEIKLPIKNIHISDNMTLEDIKKISKIKIYADTYDLLVYKHNKESMRNETIFHGDIHFELDTDKSIFFDMEMDELEAVATAILEQIELIRRNYSEQIKFQTDMCNYV